MSSAKAKTNRANENRNRFLNKATRRHPLCDQDKPGRDAFRCEPRWAIELFRVAVFTALGFQIMPSRTDHKIWGPVQNENVPKVLRISRWWKQSIKPSRAPLSPRSCTTVQLSLQEAGSGPQVPVWPSHTNVPACPVSILHLHLATSVPEDSPGVTQV